MRSRILSLMRASAATVALVGASTCGDAPEAVQTPREASFSFEDEPRVTLATEWDTVFAIGSLQDSLMPQPVLLDTQGDAILVYDFATHRLMALASNGSLTWSFGGEGRGPDEFADVRDIAVDATGRILVLDVGNDRIAVLDDEGNRLELIGLGEHNLGRTTEFAPLSDGRIVLVTRDPNRPLAVLDPAATTVDRLAMSWDGFAELHPMTSQGNVGSTPAGRWVFGFSFGPGYLAFDQLEAMPPRDFVEPMQFPRVQQTGDGGIGSEIRLVGTEFAARDIALTDQSIFVLFGGVTEHRFSLIDEYDWETGRYVGSYHLPAEGYRLATYDGDFIVVFNEPYPQILRLRPTFPES